MSMLAHGQNEKILSDFLTELDRKGLGEKSKKKYRLTLQKFGSNIDYSCLKKNDCDNIFLFLKNADLSGESKHDYWLRFRIFAKWLNPKIKLADYKLVYKKKRKLPEDILTIEDVKNILLHADKLRDRAMISLLYDLGCRPGELLGLRHEDVTFDDNGIVVRLDGKTGMRRVRIITTLESDRHLKTFLDTRKDSSGQIFDIGEGRLLTLIKSCARKTEMTKRVYSYLFRHTRATHLSQQLTESQMKIYLGWGSDSDMPGTYIHLSGADIDGRVLQINEKNETSISASLHQTVSQNVQQNVIVQPQANTLSFVMPAEFMQFISEMFSKWKEQQNKAAVHAENF